MRKFYWYITAYIKKHGLTFILSVLGAVVFFSFLLPILGKKVTIKQKKYIGIIGEYNLQSLPKEVKNKLSVGLTKVDEQDQSIKPLLAERWITENDGRTYRFTLKKNVAWQDGQPLEPQDINYNFKDVETISTPNDIIFKLPDTFAPFPSVVTEPIFKQTEGSYLLFFKKPNIIGIGPYKINNYQTKGGRLQEIVLDGPDNRLIYRFYLTELEAINGFKKGEVDVLRDINQPKDLKEWQDKYAILEPQINYNQYLAVFFNNNQPVFSKNIRQALAYALDKPKDETRATGPIHPQSWAFLDSSKSYEKDLDRAIERLLATIPPQKLDLTLTTTSIFANTAEDIKRQWEEFGRQAVASCQQDEDIENKDSCNNAAISVQIKISNFPDTQNYELLLMGQEIPVDPDQYFLWHSDQPTNFTNYQNTRVDSLLEKGRQTLEQKERLTVYQEFQQFLLEDPPAIFLEYLTSYDIKRN